jgi:hypothetical protein
MSGPKLANIGLAGSFVANQGKAGNPSMQMQQPSGRSNFRISHQSGIGGIDSSLNVDGRKS